MCVCVCVCACACARACALAFIFMCVCLCVYLCVFIIGAEIAQWLERRTRDRKVAGSNPCRSGGRIFFSRVNFMC